MKKHLISATLFACTVLAAIRAAAQQTPAEQALEARFRQLDKNRDGKITTDELKQSAFFKQRDANADGAITLAEAQAVLAASIAVDAVPSQPTTAAIRKAPQALVPADHGVGRLVGDAQFTDLAGKSHQLSEFSKQRAIVVAMTCTSCPLSKKYLPTLQALAESYSRRGVTFVLVNPMATDKAADMQTAAKSVEGHAFYVPDQKGSLAQSAGALTTTDVIVLDASRTIVYHGAIDDQYGFGYAVDAPRHQYLADALDALLANQKPLVAATGAPGCTLDFADKSAAVTPITYHNRVSRIMEAHCVECHHHEGVAPFSLRTYEDVVAHAGMIGQVVEQGTMPPWFAGSPDAPEGKPHFSPWTNDRSLAGVEKADLLAWINGGKPQGEARDAPILRSFAEGWQIGKPDAIFEFAEPVPVKATGIMPYESIVVETKLTEDKWVEAIEVQPGERGVMHHMLVFLQAANDDRVRSTPADEAADEVNGFWGIYVPGNSSLAYPAGFAKRLPKGSKLRCQIHYRPNGTATNDRSRIGVIFAKQPPRHEVRVAAIVNPRISIPPGAENHREDAILPVPLDLQVLSFLPHMHLRAKACRYRVVDGAGVTRTLLDIPRYDFNWQLLYRYTQPQALSKGDTIKFTVWYDNSEKNPANPDPAQTVRYGRQLSDEMHLGYVEYFVPNEKPGEAVNPYARQR